MHRFFKGALALAAVLWIGTATAQTSLYYREIARDGKVYVFNTPEKFAQFEATGEFGTNLTMVNQGPNGETVVFDLYRDFYINRDSSGQDISIYIEVPTDLVPPLEMPEGD